MDHKTEAIIHSVVTDCDELIGLISDNISSPKCKYFLQCFFIQFRNFSYFFCDKRSPLYLYGSRFDKEETELLKVIVDIRDVSAHVHLDSLWINNIFLSCALIFADDDVKVQFGSFSASLLKTVNLYRKIKRILKEIPELEYLFDDQGWDTRTLRVDSYIQALDNKLKSPGKLIEEQFNNRES